MNIAIIFGGKSSEHDISVITALQVINAIDKGKYKIYPIYITKNGEWLTGEKLLDKETYIDFQSKKFNKVTLNFGKKEIIIKKLIRQIVKIDCALLCLHGLNGEDGTVQGALELASIPYTSSSVLGSSVCMDKVIMKQLFKANGFKITDFVWFTREEFETNQSEILDKIKKEIDYPYIVKPANLGSSIGISKCECEDELITGIEIACQYDSRIIVEKAVENLREINCACLGYENFVKTSRLEEPVSWNKFLGFKEKYLTFSKSAEKGEPELDESLKLEIKNMSEKAFKTLCQSGVVRIDYLLDDKTKEIFINEINSIPGSLANYLFPEHFGKLLDELIAFALKREKDKNRNKFSYKSTALFEFIKNGTCGKNKKY